MKRYKYDSIIKGIFNSIGWTLFFVATIYFILMILIDNLFSITALIFAGSGIITIIVGYLMRILLRNINRCCVIFKNGVIYIDNKSFYDYSIKYFKFYISIFEPSLVIPKLYIKNESNSIVVYLTKKDVKKLIKAKYSIDII